MIQKPPYKTSRNNKYRIEHACTNCKKIRLLFKWQIIKNTKGICRSCASKFQTKRSKPPVNYTHKSTTRLYSIYKNMKSRCTNEKSPNYKYYGKRGIKICYEWQRSFAEFMVWSTQNGYNDNLSLDRINNDGDYSPENCRWATIKQQARNKTSTRLSESIVKEIRRIYYSCHVTYVDLAKIFGVDPETIRSVISNKTWV